MKLAILALALLASPASAEGLKVRTSDLDLSSPVGVHDLTQRFLTRMYAICGSPFDAAMAYAQTGGGKEQRALCKSKLEVEPSTHPAVKAAFADALDKFR